MASSTKVKYLYHPESDCYLTMTPAEWRKAAKTADGGTCVELTRKEYHHRRADQEAELNGAAKEITLSPSEYAREKAVADRGVFKVSQSKVKTYRRCLHAYDLRYNQKLRRKRKPRALQFGTMIHEMLELHINGDDPQSYIDAIRKDVKQMRLFAAEREEYGDILDDVSDIIAAYVDYWDDEDLVFFRTKGRSAEHTFEIELFPSVIWTGKIDFIVRTPNKLRWLGEHKTFNRKPSDDDRWRNLQSVSYFRANDILGWAPLDGVLWDYIHSKPPAMPGLLKNGDLSVKRIDTLPATIHRIIENHDKPVEPETVKTLLSMAEKGMENYFQRIHTPVNRAVSDMVFNDFTATIEEMVAREEKRPNHWPMNVDKHCGWCDYEPLCRARLQGLDVDYVKEREYEHGTKKDKDVGSVEEDDKPAVHSRDFSEVERFACERARIKDKR